MTEEEKKARQREYARAWSAKNHERKLEIQRAWYRRNREHAKAYQRAWREDPATAKDVAKKSCSGNMNQVIGSYANGRYSRCGFSASREGNRKIAPRRKEVLTRMAKIRPGWRK